MNLPPLIPGILRKRYKRFLADIELENGEMITAHCPNPGRMQSCSEPGRRVMISKNDLPHRKLAYTWELYRAPDSWVNVNTLRANAIVAEALRAESIPELAGYSSVQAEIKSGDSRIDFLLHGQGGKCFVEVKSVTLVEHRVAMFPDAVTLRGYKHLLQLQQLAISGSCAVIFFLVQRQDAERFCPARHIDPRYADALQSAVQQKVKVVVYQTRIDEQQITVANSLPFSIVC
ncbi:MAG TPA: DNA/RNA nuclease SfsA [bacterium]|nr:DNA/RNA nuclease SfsA [bacterium]HNT66330.1 DNA/RNA nuclease SfsA [bacterium]